MEHMRSWMKALMEVCLSSLCSRIHYEEDFLCNQVHRHHYEDSRPNDNFEDDKTHDMYSKEELSFNPSYDQELHLKYADKMKSDEYNKENRLKDGFEDCSNISSDHIPDICEEVFPRHRPFFRPLYEHRLHPNFEEKIESNKHNEMKSDEYSSERFSNVLSNQTYYTHLGMAGILVHPSRGGRFDIS